MALRELDVSFVQAIGPSIFPLPGILVVLVDDLPSDTLHLPAIVDARKRLWQRSGISLEKIRKRFGAEKPQKGIVVASGRNRRGENQYPMPRFGCLVYVLPDRHALRVHPGDEDLPELGSRVPKGKTLCFYGMGEPWHEAVIGIDV